MEVRTRPLISIIIPCRNMASELEQCLAHIQAASFDELEVIVVDGASDDGTGSVLEQFRAIVSKSIIEPDRGIYDALNKGCKVARGRYFYFLGADDRILDNLKEAATHLQDKKTVYYGDVILSRSGKRYDGPFSLFKMARTNISHQAIFYPRQVFDCHQFSLKYPIQADWELNMRLFGKGLYQFTYIGIPIALFAEAGLSSKRQDVVFNTDYLALVKQYFPRHVYFYRKALLTVLSVTKMAIPHALLVRLNKLGFRL